MLFARENIKRGYEIIFSKKCLAVLNNLFYLKLGTFFKKVKKLEMTGNKIIFPVRNIFSREYLGSSKNNYFLLKRDESGKKRLFRLFGCKKHFFDRFSEIVQISCRK